MQNEPPYLKPCHIVAEIGCGHLGKMSRAKELVRLAALAGAEYAKFQKRNPKECVPAYLHDRPHPNLVFSCGKTYLEHRINLEFSLDQHAELKDYCSSCGIEYATSVWDITSAREIISINPPYIKVPSACNHDFQLLKLLFNDYDGGVHVSTGMMTPHEVDTWCDDILQCDVDKSRLVVYHTTSEYPCRFDRLYLLDIEKLHNRLSGFGIDIGFSNHGFGIAGDIASLLLGANWIERHFIDDRTIKYSDAAASLEPDGLRRLCRDVRNIQSALQHKLYLSDEEKDQILKLRTYH